MATYLPSNDLEYHEWLRLNPDGFVINIRSSHKPDLAVLHRSDCWMMTKDRDPGAYTEHNYRKVCADTKDELRNWVKTYLRHDGTFSKECSVCRRS